ncbi:MerR family transcriptional regulator [Streptomyces sp. NPDC003035]|uniref:MerR family transcriptional regulator n=1 Tax=unclassified Streptomyces TaxID=2593676 RepID=UPI0033B56D16
MALAGLTIGQAAAAAGLTRKALRVYEAKGLLPEAERSTTGYRLYSAADVELLVFIRRARSLGFHLDDIRDILTVRRGGAPACGTVRDLLDARIVEADAAIAELRALRRTLADTRERADDCAGDELVTVCAIIEEPGTAPR